MSIADGTMGADPQMIQQLMGAMGGGQQQGASTPLGGAAQLMQKIMLMQAMQKGQPQRPEFQQQQLQQRNPQGQMPQQVNPAMMMDPAQMPVPSA